MRKIAERSLPNFERQVAKVLGLKLGNQQAPPDAVFRNRVFIWIIPFINIH